jgi:hypothetical protein
LANGTFVKGEESNGLTCSTFVIEVFRSAGIELLRYSDWPHNRDGDDKWHDHIVAEIRRKDAEHANAIAKEKGCARFRPEEVTGTCASKTLPASFSSTEVKGIELRNFLLNS